MAETQPIQEAPPEYIYPALRPEGNLFGAKLGQDLESYGMPGIKPGDFFQDAAGNVYDWLTDQFIMVNEPSTLGPVDLSQPPAPPRRPAMAAPPAVRNVFPFGPVEDLQPPVTLQMPNLGVPMNTAPARTPMAATTPVSRIDIPTGQSNVGTEIPGMPGTNYGDEIINNTGDRWNYEKGDWDYATTPQPPYKTDEGAVVYPGGVSPVVPEPETPRSTITLPTEAVTTTPVTPAPVYEDKVTITPPTFPTFEFLEPAPTRTPITLPGTSVISRPMPAVTPLPELPTVPTDTRRAPEALLRSFRDINYDPEEILAAAMRSMGGRMARRSILNELS